MDKAIYQTYPKEKRLEMLQMNRDSLESVTYMKTFKPSEFTEFKDELADLDIEIARIEEEKKKAMADFKARLDPVKGRHAEILKNIRLKSVEVKEDAHKFVDEVGREVGYYNSDGYLVSERAARPGELQINIFKNRTGTND